MITALIILGRILASPLVNVFQKKLTNKQVSPEFIVMMSYLFFAIPSVPYLIIIQPFNFSQEFWFYIILLGIFDVIGNMFLVKSLQTIDLSVFGPLNSFKPVFALLFSAFLINEVPSLSGVGGVLIIITGSYFLGYQPRQNETVRRKLKISKGMIFRFLAILLTSIAAVFSKIAILLSSPLTTLVYWSLIGLPVSIIFFARKRSSLDSDVKNLKGHCWKFAGVFGSFLVLQILTLLTFQKVFVGYSLAFFQLSGLVSVAFGFHFFQERNLRYRLIGALIMFLGALLIAVYG